MTPARQRRRACAAPSWCASSAKPAASRSNAIRCIGPSRGRRRRSASASKTLRLTSCRSIRSSPVHKNFSLASAAKARVRFPNATATRVSASIVAGVKSPRSQPRGLCGTPVSEARMNVHISYKVPKTADIEREFNHNIEKLGRRLQVFRPELVHLHGIIESNSAREGYVISLNLRLPSGQMAAREASAEAITAIKACFDDLVEEVTKHKD